MRLIYQDNRFVCACTFMEKDIPKGAGFRWDPMVKQWFTYDQKIAAKLSQYADTGSVQAIQERQVEGCRVDELTAYVSTMLQQDTEAPRLPDWHTEGVYKLRPYQQEAVDKGVRFLKGGTGNGIIVIPTGGGKALVIANIARALREPTLVFQPSREILTQNYEKLLSYGETATIWSASMGQKELSNLTFATIGSTIRCKELFKQFRYVLIDEGHMVSAKGGMYHDLIKCLEGSNSIALTATPYRLHTNSFGSELRFLTRTRPRLFSELVYYIQNKQLFNEGYLCKLHYIPVQGFDRTRLRLNSTGAEFDDKSVKVYYGQIGFADNVVNVTKQLVTIRSNVLVFTRFIEESEYIVKHVPGAEIVTGTTPKAERERIGRAFKAGEIKVVTNCGVYLHGFDFPRLETVVLSNPTMSLGRYYQQIGRAIRPHPEKRSAIICDMTDNISAFGKIEDLLLKDFGNGKWAVMSHDKQLTNTYLNK